MHVLGYGVDIRSELLEEHLRWIREGRNERNHMILQRLNQLGFRITMTDVRRHAGEEVVARPHIAQALIDKGYCSDKREAFRRLLGRGRPAYVDRRRLTPPATMELIRRSGGVPVLAHPFSLELKRGEIKPLLGKLVDAGLQGLECYYPEHTKEMQKDYLRMARDFGLVATGGSDFHGLAHNHARQTHGLGGMPVPDDTFEQLVALSTFARTGNIGGNSIAPGR